MLYENKLCVLSGEEIGEFLHGKEDQIIEIVKQAYISHQKGDSALPHSTFLRFPDRPKDRIIGLPAYINGAAGIKWVASFPENIGRGMDRASATIILNSTETGRPYGILEGSIISAKRTAASAVLAAKLLSRQESAEEISLIGCGLINFEILRFFISQFRNIRKVSLFDIDIERARSFQTKASTITDANMQILEDLESVCKSSRIVSFATTASTPHVIDNSFLREAAIILNISLRDLGSNIIKDSINIVDDRDHVNREGTSIHLASQACGNTDFIVATIGQLLIDPKTSLGKSKPLIFSPFGLGILDIQLAKFVFEQAMNLDKGTAIDNFIPTNWLERPY